MKKLNIEEILSNNSELKEKKVGYVTIIGRPNVGKSTFINSLIGEDISITSSVPQTTRKKILAIYNDIDSQIIFFDTPGIHKNEKIFNQKLVKETIKSISSSDLILYFIDLSRKFGEEEKYISEVLEKTNRNILKVYTKSDLPKKIEIPEEENIYTISSINKEGFKELLEKIKIYLKNQMMLYPEEYYTDQDIYFRISEIIREKVFLNTREEIPHSVYIEVTEIEEEKELLKIQAYIYTETDSQKYIIIGKGGDLLKKIGTEARINLESIFGKKIFLSLRVKVFPKWRTNNNLLNKLL